MREAFKTEDFTSQMRMMDAMMTALERSLVGFTYAPRPRLTPSRRR